MSIVGSTVTVGGTGALPHCDSGVIL